LNKKGIPRLRRKARADGRQKLASFGPGVRERCSYQPGSVTATKPSTGTIICAADSRKSPAGVRSRDVPVGMPLPLKLLSRVAAAVLDELTADLDVGDSRKIDRGTGYMAVHVECLHRSGLGLLYSVAHYFEQNGDLVPDPDVVFVRRSDGSFCPVSFQSALGYRVAVHFREDGTIEVDEKEEADLVSFCNLWMKNIQEQQGLSPRKKLTYMVKPSPT
jgi:hypothetical protein